MSTTLSRRLHDDTGGGAAQRETDGDDRGALLVPALCPPLMLPLLVPPLAPPLLVQAHAAAVCYRVTRLEGILGLSNKKLHCVNVSPELIL